MTQQTLFGKEKILKYYCVKCNWKGFDAVIEDDFEKCPECEWACYSEKEIDENLISCYPVLKGKVK